MIAGPSQHVGARQGVFVQQNLPIKQSFLLRCSQTIVVNYSFTAISIIVHQD